MKLYTLVMVAMVAFGVGYGLVVKPSDFGTIYWTPYNGTGQLLTVSNGDTLHCGDLIYLPAPEHGEYAFTVSLPTREATK